jgi:hypothetical protein
MTTNPKIYRAVKAYETPYPDPILFHRGEVVQVKEEYKDDPDWVDWVWCEGGEDNHAWVPKQYLQFDDGQWTLSQEYNARELDLAIGEKLVVTYVVNGFGMAEKPGGERGWAPMNHLRLDEGSEAL